MQNLLVTQVPFSPLRFFMCTSCPSFHTLQWIRDTIGSTITMSLPTSRPMVSSLPGGSSYSVPALGPEIAISFGYIGGADTTQKNLPSSTEEEKGSPLDCDISGSTEDQMHIRIVESLQSVYPSAPMARTWNA